MKRMLKMKAAAVALAVAGALGAVQDVAAQANEIFIPVLVYRTGAYAPNGIPWADGFVDYLKLVNARDGGVNGIKIAKGTIVDATIISAPSSTKNKDGERDPEMHQSAKGQQWYFV